MGYLAIAVAGTRHLAQAVAQEPHGCESKPYQNSTPEIPFDQQKRLQQKGYLGFDPHPSGKTRGSLICHVRLQDTFTSCE